MDQPLNRDYYLLFGLGGTGGGTYVHCVVTSGTITCMCRCLRAIKLS